MCDRQKQVVVQLHTSADNVTLLAFAADPCRPCCCDRSISPACRANSSKYAAAVDIWDRQTDGRTPYRYIDAAAYDVNRTVPMKLNAAAASSVGEVENKT